MSTSVASPNAATEQEPPAKRSKVQKTLLVTILALLAIAIIAFVTLLLGSAAEHVTRAAPNVREIPNLQVHHNQLRPAPNYYHSTPFTIVTKNNNRQPIIDAVAALAKVQHGSVVDDRTDHTIHLIVPSSWTGILPSTPPGEIPRRDYHNHADILDRLETAPGHADTYVQIHAVSPMFENAIAQWTVITAAYVAALSIAVFVTIVITTIFIYTLKEMRSNDTVQ